MSLLGLFGHNSVFANDPDQMSKQEVHNEQKKVEERMNEKSNKLSELKAEEKEMKDALSKINLKVKENNEKLASLNEKIEKTKQEIASLKKDIAATKKKIKERKAVLKKRARAMQVNDQRTSYLSVLMGSQDFGDFIERAMAVTTIVNADQNLLEEQKKNQQQLEHDQKALNEKMEQRKQALDELESVKVQLNYQIDEKNSLIEKMKEEQLLTSSDLKDLEQDSAELSEREKELVKEEKRKARLAQQRKEQQRKEQQHEVRQNKVEVASAPSGTVKKGSSAIETAIHAGSALVGNSPYNWGGGRNSTDIANRSFDCSSFVRWAFSQAGVNLGSVTGTTTNTLVNRGISVSASSMKRGDIVFFDTYKTNGHVGIYLGNGRFLNDNSSTGVTIDSMNNPYWKSTFSGVVRRVVQ
ncbi:NlpC/P60 family protein [Halobacillus salinarum]|uniref:NlpC/P60 family protein n=1 Tax=Halobacillus salinarum TaxID=2932257 RepID=A0ABY4EMY8_9BACI|nr:C40 family peptidase [Halobacillus salinarum]UOQ45750.1 NlpC/P60 family protein [Halobacillus salinarum]